jgi:hypothetical protein
MTALHGSASRRIRSGVTPPRCSHSIAPWPTTSTGPSCSPGRRATCWLAGTSPPSPFRSRTPRLAAPMSPCGPGSASTGTPPSDRSAGPPIRCCGRSSSHSRAQTPRHSTPAPRPTTSEHTATACGGPQCTYQSSFEPPTPTSTPRGLSLPSCPASSGTGWPGGAVWALRRKRPHPARRRVRNHAVPGRRPSARHNRRTAPGGA